MFADPVTAAIKNISNIIIDMDSSYLKICVDYCLRFWDRPACFFYTWPYMTNHKTIPI